MVEDRVVGPAEVASTRLDIRAWLKTLPKRDRRLAERLVTGETASAGRIFGISPGGCGACAANYMMLGVPSNN